MDTIPARLRRFAIGLCIIASLGCFAGCGGKVIGFRPVKVFLTPDVVRQGSTTQLTVRCELADTYYFNSSSIVLNTALGSRLGDISGIAAPLTVPASVQVGLYDLSVKSDQNYNIANSRLSVIPSGTDHKLSFPAEVELDADTTANLSSILTSPLVSKLEASGLPDGITMSADNGYSTPPFNRQETTGISSSTVRFTGTAAAGTYPFKLRWSTSTALIEEVDSVLRVSTTPGNSLMIFDQDGGAELPSPWVFNPTAITFPYDPLYTFNMRISAGGQSLIIRSTSALTAGTYSTPYEGLEMILTSSGKTYRSSYGTVVVNSVSSGRADISIPLVTMMGDPAADGNFSLAGRIIK